MQSRTLICLPLLLIAGSVGVASSQSLGKQKISPTLSISDPGSWKTAQRGVEFRKITLERSEPAHTIELKVLRLDSRWIVPRVLRSAQFQLKGASVTTFVERSGAVAAVNANYFDTDGKPLAFLKTAGQATNARLSRSALYTGIFAVKDQQPFISNRDDFVPEQADEALQSGPLLLLRGVPQPIIGVPARASRRAVIGIDKDQRLLVAVTDTLIGGLYWTELQEIFSAAQWQLQASDLLNLDGGGSAQLYIKTGKFEEAVPGAAEVPVAIGFFSKSN